MRALRPLAAAGWAAWLVLPAVASAAVEAPLAIGVAAFERAGAGPDFAALLAERLAARARVVGPAALGAPALADPAPDAARSWAVRAQVGAVVVGRAAPLGGGYRLELALLSGRSGSVERRWVLDGLEAAGSEQRLETLADELIEQSAVLAVQPAEARAEASEPRFGFGLERSRKIAIRSDALEALREKGGRRLVFTENVVVSQAELRMTADRLEAFYPPEAREPERLVATGRVRVIEGGREARCDEATYRRQQESLVCRGHAELRDGADWVRGDRIEIDLASDSVRVRGGATVELQPSPPPEPAGVSAGEPGPAS